MGTHHCLPFPQRNDDNAAFWDGSLAHRFMVQKCSCCGQHRFPAVPTCKQCMSLKYKWEAASGKGTVWSWARFHRAYFSGVEVPYTVAIVELAEGPLIATNLDEDSVDPTIGAAVEVIFKPIGQNMLIPLFRLVQ